MKLLILVLILLTYSTHTTADGGLCYVSAGQRYHIQPNLLRAIGLVESHENDQTIGINRDHHGQQTSIDYGLMQINTSHLAELQQLGVIQSSQDLLSKPCLNIQIGAWILARHLKKCGQSWECLGSYNAGFSPRNSALRKRYAQRVYREWVKLNSPSSRIVANE